VLVAQRSLLTLEDELAISEGTVTGNLVRLYKALGGGWQPMAGEDGARGEGRTSGS
jgi:outer membrane protein TolC